MNFGNALIAKDKNELETLLTIVIIGAGLSGVKIAGALAEMNKYVLPKDYPELMRSEQRFTLLRQSAEYLVRCQKSLQRKPDCTSKTRG